MISLSSPWSAVEEVVKVILAFSASLLPWYYALTVLGLTHVLSGCGSVPITTEYLDSVAVERARSVCEYAHVPVQDMPACIERGVNARQSSQILGAWSPIVDHAPTGDLGSVMPPQPRSLLFMQGGGTEREQYDDEA